MAEPQPTHLDPSELGTKEHWDEYYERDLQGGSDDENEDRDDRDSTCEHDDTEIAPDLSDLDSWFDDVGAPAKTLAFLTSETFPWSPNFKGNDQTRPKNPPFVLDLGTGNGSALFSLHLQGGYTGPMIGIDYSRKSIELADSLKHRYAACFPSKANETSASARTGLRNINFYVFDIIEGNPRTQAWWSCDGPNPGFDLVLDKGTFDAISLSSATVANISTGREQRICELYPAKVLELVRVGGFLLVTSCNWTEEEVISWFTGAPATSGAEVGQGDGEFEVYDTIKYPVFEFGGQKGQGVASVCFRKVGGK